MKGMAFATGLWIMAGLYALPEDRNVIFAVLRIYANMAKAGKQIKALHAGG